MDLNSVEICGRSARKMDFYQGSNMVESVNGMKCFIASAFDHADVDAIFNKAITPVLNELKIKKLRVDRVEHNDDIDDKIFFLIKGCDFCIADLTYARPSVYYEAGFASGLGKPVIYISRKDHFRARVDDPAGNLRVHFDLQMKNIIPWTGPDEIFRRRLLKRIKHVCGAIKPRQKKRIIETPEQNRFQAQSIDDQIKSILEKGKNIVFANGFRFTSSKQFRIRIHGQEEPKRAERFEFERLNNGVLQRLKLVAKYSFTKSDFRSIYFGYHDFSEEQSSKIKSERTIIIYASLQPVRQTSIKSVLSSYAPKGNGIYKISKVPTYWSSEKKLDSRTVVIIDGYKSVSEFSQLLKSKLKLLL